MPTAASISFRDQTTGRINDLLTDEGLICAKSQNLLSYLAGALLNYKDEGVEFTPSVVLCSSIQGFSKSFPGAVAHNVGVAPLDPASGPKILKDCAPLSNKNWFIYIERNDDVEVRYGVFTYFRLPTAIPLHEGVTIDGSQFAVLIRKVSATTIEMRAAKGNILTLTFSTVRDGIGNGAPIEAFSAACCSDVKDERIKKDFGLYFLHVLQDALTSSHGTILVCGRNLDLTKVPELQDAVPVTPELNFQAAFSDYIGASSAGSILNLQRCEELLQGFFRCDGVVVFDTCGRVVAYRVFFRPGANSSAAAVVGGARRRAYEGIKDLVGPNILSVLFRSQDGLTLHHGAAV